MTLENLRANALRPDSRSGHHMLALPTRHTSTGYPKEKPSLLDEFCRQRAMGFYGGSFDPTKAKVEAIISTVNDLKKHLKAWLKSHRPELL